MQQRPYPTRTMAEVWVVCIAEMQKSCKAVNFNACQPRDRNLIRAEYHKLCTKAYDVSNVAIYPELNELNVSTSVIELSVPGRGSKSTILFSCSKQTQNLVISRWWCCCCRFFFLLCWGRQRNELENVQTYCFAIITLLFSDVLKSPWNNGGWNT